MGTKHNRTSKLYGALGLALGTALLGFGPTVSAAGVDKPGAVRATNDGAAIVVVNQILNKWEAVAEAAGKHGASWREIYQTQLQQMSAPTLRRLSRMDFDANVDAKRSYARFTEAVASAIMTTYAPSNENKANIKLGSTTTDQVFIPVTPCRVLDTRNVGGPITAGFTRNFKFYAETGALNWGTLQGGEPGSASTACPGTVNPNGGPPSAAMVTVSVISPSEGGNWVAWGGANPVPTTSALNWTGPGQILVNTTVIPAGGRAGTGPGGGIQDFAIKLNGPGGQAQMTADVVGYFVENLATPLGCVTDTARGTGTANFLNASALLINNPACTTGYTVVSSGCAYVGDLPAASYLQEDSVSFGYCQWYNNSGSTLDRQDFEASARCCLVPGR